MEAKKNPNLDFKNLHNLFLSIGLLISLLIVIASFEWKTYERSELVELSSDSYDLVETIEIPPTKQPPPPPPKIQNVKVIEVPDIEEIKEEIEINLDVEITEETVIEEYTSITTEEEEEVTDEIFTVVEQAPVPTGGYSAFYKYVSETLKFPKTALFLNIDGKVFVQFVVDQEGKISDVVVLKGIHADCDAEAVRVITNSPPWIPGKQRGRPVKVRIVIPIHFKLLS